MKEYIAELELLAKKIYGTDAFIAQNNFSRWLIFRSPDDRVARLGNIGEVEDFLTAKLQEQAPTYPLE